MDNWEYKGFPLDEIPEGYMSFIYKIQLGDDYYIGKKKFISKIRRNFGKKEIAALRDKRLRHYEYIIKESNWKTYCSSSNRVKCIVEVERDIPVREILYLCKTWKEAGFIENKMLFNCIHEEKCLNENVNGTYFKEEILEWMNQN